MVGLLGLQEPMPSTAALSALRLLSWALILLGTAALATGQSTSPMPATPASCSCGHPPVVASRLCLLTYRPVRKRMQTSFLLLLRRRLLIAALAVRQACCLVAAVVLVRCSSQIAVCLALQVGWSRWHECCSEVCQSPWPPSCLSRWPSMRVQSRRFPCLFLRLTEADEVS